MSKTRYMSFCYRCYHVWERRSEKLPKVCPKCKSPYWNRPRKRVSKGFVLKMEETIINIHDAIIKLSGGEYGIRDEGGIYNSTYKLLRHQDRHRKDPVSLGTFILNEFAKKHHFVDGNKRTAYVVAKIFMLINKCHLQIDYSQAVNFILKIAEYNSEIGFENIKRWLKENCDLVEEKDVEKYLKNVFVNLYVGEENGKQN